MNSRSHKNKYKNRINMWIARDYDGTLWLFTGEDRPSEMNKSGVYDADDCAPAMIEKDLYPTVTFETGPVRAELVLLK